MAALCIFYPPPTLPQNLPATHRATPTLAQNRPKGCQDTTPPYRAPLKRALIYNEGQEPESEKRISSEVFEERLRCFDIFNIDGFDFPFKKGDLLTSEQKCKLRRHYTRIADKMMDTIKGFEGSMSDISIVDLS